MRLISYRSAGRTGLALEDKGRLADLFAADPGLPDDVAGLLRLANWRERVEAVAPIAPTLDPASIDYLAPVRTGEKILCVGLNYVDHAAESRQEVPDYPVFFTRFASSLIGHKAPLLKPGVSDQLDYEGELVVVLGEGGRRIARADALTHVAGYTIFNDASVRDYQFKGPQWTMGKNFDATGACGPAFVTADELPPGAAGLRLETRVNGIVEQSASTADMIFDVATLISIASEVMTLRPGDMIVTGTPSGVGLGKTPPLYMRAGDVCEITIEAIGTLENRVAEEPA